MNMIALISVVVLVICILFGIHIAFSLTLISFLGVLITSHSFQRAYGLLSSTGFDAIRDYMFCVIPLFMLMGSLMAKSGAAEDLFKCANYFMRKIPGGLAIATVIGNAIFAAVTGVSVASASIFSKIAVPEMIKLKYDKKFAVGAIAGTSVLGMLIPPSLLFIVYGMVAEVSIGKLFMAGIIPGIVLAIVFTIGIIIMSTINPVLIGRNKKDAKSGLQTIVHQQSEDKVSILLIKTIPVMLIILIVLGGIWGGFFTPTEASAFGAILALIVAFFRRQMDIKSTLKVLLESAMGCASIMFLMISAQMYSRMLAMSGLVSQISGFVLSLKISPYLIIALFLVLLLLLGCILDSTSILLLTIPIIIPIARGLGFDLIWFGVVMVITIEMGMLTPPFGMVVFAIKSTLGDKVMLDEIFAGSVPFLIMIFVALLIIIAFPTLSTFIPNTLM